MSEGERLNFYRLSLLIMDGGTPTLKWLFEKQYAASGDLEIFLKSKTTVLDGLHKRKIINVKQMDLLRPSTGIKPSVEKFDSSLLITLLTNICPIQQPHYGWTVSPAASDLCTGADILRVRDARNNLFHHAKCGISDAEFQLENSNVSAAISRLSNQLDQQQQVNIQKIINDARHADRDFGREKEICNLIFLDKIDEMYHMLQGIWYRGNDGVIAGFAASEASHSLPKDEKKDGTKDQPDIDMRFTLGENSIIIFVKLYADLKKELTREIGMSIAKVLLKEENSTDVLEEIKKASSRRLCIDSLLKRVIQRGAATVQSFLMEIKSKCPGMANLLDKTIITEEDRKKFQLIDNRIQTNGRICSRVHTRCRIDEADVEFFQRRLCDSPEIVDKIADALLSKFYMSFYDHSRATLHSDVFTRIHVLFETIRSCHLDSVSELECVLGSDLYKKWIEFRNETSGPNGENTGIWQSIIQWICGAAPSLMESICQTFHIDFIRTERGSLVLIFKAGDNFSIELLKPESVKKKVRELLEKTCPEHHPLFKAPIHVTIFIKSAKYGEKEEIHFFLETIKDRKEIEDGHSRFGRHERDYMIEEMDPTPLKQLMFEKLKLDECSITHIEDIISWNDIGRGEKMKILLDILERFEDGYELLQRYCEENDKFVYDKVFQKARQQSRTDHTTELGYDKGEGMQKLFSTWIDFSEDPTGMIFLHGKMHYDNCEAEEEDGEDTSFCSQCGHEFKKKVVLCQGTLKNGAPCKAEIQKKFNFCKKCGTKVDSQWFFSNVVTCIGKRMDGSLCGNTLEKEDMFCTRCGTVVPAEERDPVVEMHSVETDLMTEESQSISGLTAIQTGAEYSSCFAPASIHASRTVSSHSDGDELDVNSSEVDGQKISFINVKKMEAKGDKSAPGIQEKGDKEENMGIEMEDEVEKLHLQSKEYEPISGKKRKEAKNDDDANRESLESSNEERAVLKEQGVRIWDLQGEALIQEMRAEANREHDMSFKGGAIINDYSVKKDQQREPPSDQVEARALLGQKPQEKESTQELHQKAVGVVIMVGQPEAQEPSREFEKSNDITPEEWKTQAKAVQDKGVSFEIEITEGGGQVKRALSPQSKQLIKEIAKTYESQGNERVDNVEGQKEEDQSLENENVGGEQEKENEEKSIEEQLKENEEKSIEEQEEENEEKSIEEILKENEEKSIEEQEKENEKSIEEQEKENEEKSVEEQEKENEEKSIEDDQESKDVAETSQSRKDGFSKSKLKRLRKQEKKQREKKIEAAQGEKHSKRKVKDKKKQADTTGIETHGFRDENYITVHFRVLVSPDFKWDLKKDKILIKTKLEDFGDFESNKNHMQHVRHVKEFHEMLISLKIKREIAFEKGFCYRYAVLHEKNDIDKVECEYYYKAGWTSLTADRYFLLTDEWKNKKEFHRFDGIINPDKTRVAQIIDKVSSSYTKKKLTEDAEISTRIFAAEILVSTEKRSAKLNKETMETLGMLLSGLMRTYWVDAKCWSSEEELKQTMSDVLLSPLLKSLELETPLTDYRETPQKAERRMHNALFVLIVSGQYKLQLSSNYMSLLARSLLLRPHHETQELHDYAVVDAYFSNDKEKLKMILIDFCNNFPISDKDPSWLHCIPLLHMISGDVRQYQSPSADDKHDIDYVSWCGIQLIRNAVEKFREIPTTWLIPLQEMIRILTPLFELDYFLPRTLMAALRLHEVEEVMRFKVMPPEVCIAACTNYIKYTRPMLRDGVTAVRDEDKEMVRCLNELWKYLEKFKKPEHWSEECLCKHAQLTYKIAGQMVTTTLREIHMKELHNIIAAVIQVFLQAIAFYDNIQVNIEPSESQPYIDMLIQICYQIRSDWLNQMFSPSHQRDLKGTFSAWSSLLSPDDLKSPTIAQMWNDEILQDFTHRLEQELHSCPTDGENFIQFYCTEMDTLHHRLQTCLSDLAFKAVESGYMVECTDFDRRQMERFGDLLSHLFESQWISRMAKEGVHKDHKMLAFMLEWPPFSHFMAIFTGDKKIPDFLGSDCISHLKSCISLLKSLISVLLNGHVALEDLDLIQSSEEKFLELGKRLQGLEEYKTEENVDILKAVKGRQKEVDCYRRQIAQIKILLNLCQYIPSVDITSSVQKRLSTLSDFRRLHVCDICESVSVDIREDLQSYKPQIKAFELPQLVLMNLDKLESQYKSRVFLQLWEETGKKNKVNSLEELFSKVWIPVNEKWLTICTEIASGHITFVQFECYLGKLSVGDDYGCIDEEMIFLNVEVKTRKERLEQLRQHRNIRHCIHGAEIILQIVHALALKGDFGDVRKIASKAKGRAIKMQDFDTSLMQTCELLQEMTAKRSACLEAVIKSEKLLKWLKESMKGGMKELKVFVDLASISAGDGDMEIDKVNCLHAAITGYAPLVFDLDVIFGYKALRERCNLVWEALEADPALPQKLVSISHQLDWLQSVKQAHGSIEVASLEQASAINADGMYCVGKLEAVKENEMCLDLHKVISLRVASEQKNRQYSFDQLQDLQNRLMLVAGKAEHGKDNVERFTMVFDSVTRLANVYNKLISAGCVLYKNWQARFFCRSRPLKSPCAHIQCGEGVKAFQVCISDAEDITTIIPELAKFMENCLEKWLGYINEKRKKYFELNFFTTDQLVILQQELAKMGTGQDPDIKIYPLLSAVKESCTYEDLQDAMHRASKDVEKVQTESGYTERTAMDVSKHLHPDQIVEDHVREKNLEALGVVGQEEIMEAEATKISCEGWTSSVTSPTSVTGSSINKHERAGRSENTETLIKDLEHLWETFLGSVSSRVKDSLSVEHLGLVLKQLARKDTLKMFRPFPPGLVQGVPNLIICHKADILRTLLSVYMVDSTQPLPRADEVLMCDSHTTLDQLDVFWRRSLGDRSSRIHCLVNADLLDFEVSDKGERCLENYMQLIQNEDYRLIVICSLENEYQSRMVTALEKYRRQLLPISNEKIASYVQQKLQVDISVPTAKLKPAAVVDFDRSCVRIVKSTRAGMGKSLYVKRRVEDLSSQNRTHGRQCHVIVPLQDREINISKVTQILLSYMLPLRDTTPRIFHLDISHEVQEGVDCFLFSLLILGCLTDSFGHVWRRSARDLYLVETMPIMERRFVQERRSYSHVHKVFEFLPFVKCRSPMETVDILAKRQIPGDCRQSELDSSPPTDQLFDQKEIKSLTFQRPYHFLSQLDQRQEGTITNPSESEVLMVLLRHCGVPDPSWAELHHFVRFLDTQLKNFQKSSFCSPALAKDLPGFQYFVLKFLIQMSRDFSTRSLIMAEESPKNIAASLEGDKEMKNVDDLAQFKLRRTWESSPHPYLFFNTDDETMTFVGFNIDRNTRNLVDHQTGQVLENDIMSAKLYKGLKKNGVPIQEDFDRLSREDKIARLCQVMGNDDPYDPDQTYELTTDNVKKILAIYMRFRCDIPVIIMGETGCGKTRLVKFLCALQTPPGADVKNMILMKVHGGITNSDIIKKVKEAEKIAQENAKNYGPHMYTVLFFDEANTTESIGLIKEILCDKSMEGRPLANCPNLKMVAACNPYRKHSKELITRLSQAGLGYHVDADKTTDRLGRVPMRNLVYRVQPLPQSLLSLVWDFGQLNIETEDIYIQQMIIRYINQEYLPDIPGLVPVISGILTASQNFMRQQKDECSFVSLRDIDRVLSVMSWFYRKDPDIMNLSPDQDSSSDTERDEEEEAFNRNYGDHITWSLVLALGVCYIACLKKRKEYTEHIWKYFKPPLKVLDGPRQIEDTVIRYQDIYLHNVQLDKNIAKNTALKENVFMMVICTELRIPLFLVGKPGSSKSLAKTIVADAMQGNAARVAFFREFKQIQMVSFQCSPLSTPDGIVGTFRQCAKFQKDKDLDKFVSVVVLDEVGLAEDSPRMPLKTLHPLLEDGCQGDEEPEPYKKVAFIGISNWALDPAKMNRGILVQRDVPDLQELENSALGICSSDATTLNLMKPLIKPLAESYLQLFKKAAKDLREFYGLRDFYSLIKMIYSFCEKSKKFPTWHQLLHAIKRNFGGLNSVNPEETFTKKLSAVVKKDAQPQPGDPDCSPTGLIHACFDVNKTQCESRYLLLLTENYGALTILQQQILNIKDAIIIFGSSFPSDQKYTQVCRNINRIKVCMETGNTVVLLNLENLYESLYDALNQYYVYFGGDRYVDLGLGTHRVKCRVHKNFRLIVVAEKEVVYKKFPIPLINRLEKHFLTVNTLLKPEQGQLAERLEKWADNFSTEKKITSLSQQSVNHGRGATQRSVGDVIIGCHTDTYSAIILFVWEDLQKNERKPSNEKVLDESKKLLLWSATPEAVVRLGKCRLPHDEVEVLMRTYWEEQTHDNLSQYLQHKLGLDRNKNKDCFAQVTTHSRLLSQSYKEDISRATEIQECRLLIETLQSFDTEQQFSRKIRSFFESHPEEELLLVVQCDSGDTNASLVACARYCILDVHQQVKTRRTAPCHVVFIIQLPRIVGGCFTGFQCGLWHSVHIDDLRVQSSDMPTIQGMMGVSIATLMKKTFTSKASRKVPMETNKMRDHDAPEEVYSLNACSLIMPSIQSALAMIRDREEATERSTKRVNLVLQLMHKISDGVVPIPSFFQGVTSHLVALMKEKEDKSGLNPSNWLPNEASKPENITKAGTFRRACIQYLESRISPILAGIIAHIDTNQNLDILSEHISQGDWVAQLWLHIFNTPAAIQLKYSDLQSPGRQQELSEVIVKTTGCQGLAFQAELPFSWLMFEQINAISRNTHENLKEKEQTVLVLERIVKIFKETPLGKLLNDFQGPVTDIMHCYTQDFINMAIRVQSDAERELVFRVILESATELSAQNPACLLTGLVSIHEAYQHRAQQLAYFRSINQVWPECSETLKKLLEEQPNHHLSNQTLDVQGISLLLDQLNTQDAKYFSDTKGQASWMKKVFCYRPVVEQCLSLYSSHPELNFNPAVVRARQLWIRDMVFKLYIEHIGTMDREADHFAVKNCMVLWQMLEKVVDLKQVESFKEVEEFLKICNGAAIEAFDKEQPRCPICKCDVLREGSPVTLPCGDTICLRCYRDDKLLDYNKCRKCHSNIPADFVPDKAMKESKEIKGFKDYQSRCNSFFMDVVSQLCFAENTPPSDEVVDMLLGYITMTTSSGKNRAATKQLTKELTIFNDCFDPTPVFRSFLLQLLLRTSEDRVYNNLEKYLNQAQRVMESTEGLQKEHFNQLCLLVVQCLEDHYHREAMGRDDVEFARDCLQKAGQLIRHDQPSRKLVGIAMTKFGLAVTSKYIHLAVTTASRPNNIWTLCDSAVAVCKESCHGPKIFFIRYLCRCYGIGSYRTMCQKREVSFLRELCLENSSKTEINEDSDRYIVCGPDYTRIRDAITQVELGEKIEKLNRAVKESTLSNRWKEVFVCLAVHREITLDHIHGQTRKKSVQKAMAALQNYCKNIKHPMNKEMIQAIIHNKYGKHVALLTVAPGLTIQLQGVLCLLVHCDLILRNLQGDRTLMQPLIKMATHPETLTDPYLPTMPQDNADIRRAILASQRRSHKHSIDRSHYRAVLRRCLTVFLMDLVITKTLDYLSQQNVLDDLTLRDISEQTTTSDKVRKLFENIQRRGKECYEKFKECLVLSGQADLRKRLEEEEEVLAMELNTGTSGCPNGRPNITGNYGPSVQAQTCRECGSLVCRLLPGNTPDRQQHMTEPGHILGAASQRAQGAIPEGDMSPAYCAVVRLMLHLSMMLGANHNLEAICQLIKPKIAADMVVSFLMDYIQRDLNDLHQTLGRSVDDVFVMVHYILNQIMLKHDEKEQLQEEICGLRTKAAQLEWERKFSKRFLAPVLQTLDAVLQEMNQNLAKDKRPGSDPLLCHLFETNTTQGTFAPTELQEDPSMWCYRTRITIDHLRHEFDVQMTASNMNQNQHRVLHLFLREEHHLRALRFIPSILKLHRILFQKFQRQLGRAEASSITVDSVIKEDWGKDLKALIQDYANAWELVRNSLSMTMQILQEYCRKRIDGSTPISQLLPSSSGAGLCTFSMMWFLFKKQNDFLEEYCKMQKSSSTENLPKVKVRELTPAHLISYHPEQDILPLVLANCNYSFKMAKGTTIEYNFANLERQITDRFLFGKSLIDIEIEEMVYRADFTNAATFSKLEEKIPQEPLSSGVKHKISEEFRSLPDLCQALDNLDIAISFLKSIGGNPENSLDKFMVETLKMEQSLHNASAKLYCQYRHVKSLWLLLSLELEKSKILAKHKEMIFDGIPEDFHQPLTSEQRKALSDYLQPLPLKCLIPLLELMFECIVLFISVPQNPDDKVFAKETRFGDYLQELFDDREMEVHIQLQNFPPDVLSKCCVSAWELTYSILRDKEKSGHRH